MELQNLFQADCLASRIIRRVFDRQRLKMMFVMDRVLLMRWKAYFLFLIATSQFFVHNGSDCFTPRLCFRDGDRGCIQETCFKKLMGVS